MKRIVSLTLMGLLLALTQLAAQTPARKADELVNSIGVNVHFSFGESPYHQHYDSARNLLGESGIRFIRDRIDPSASRRERQQMDWWDLYGVQIAGIVDAKENVGNGQYPTLEEVPELLRIAREAYGPQRIAGLMGLNEWDIARDTTSAGAAKKKTRSQWVSEWRLQQRTLYDAVKSDSVLSAVPVVMSPLAHSFNIEFLARTEGDPQPLGNVSDMVDIGNDHPYPSSIGLPNEERSDSVPLPIDNIVDRIHQVAGANVPVWFSETGYSQPDDGTVAPDTTISKHVSGRAVAKYTPRLLAHHFKNADIEKTFLYELLSTNDRTPWGLVREDFTKNPAFYTVSNLIKLCEEATWDTATNEWITPPNYTPQSLDYTLAGDLTDVEQLLLQKSDGTYLLLLWQEVLSFDAVARKDIAHPLRNIQISLNDQVASSVNVYRLYRETNPSAALTPLATYSQTSQLTVGVPDDIVALEIKPAPDAPPRPALDSAVASYATLAPVVDGNLTEYDLFTTFTRTVVGSSENQVRFASQWNEDYLYVGVQVVDADLQNDSPESWYDDNVELFLDPTLNRGTTYDSLDRQLLLGWADSTLRILPQALAGVQYAQANLADGYSMEMAIPWTQLGGVPTAGHVLGFDVGVNDDDDGAEREAQLMWVGSGENFRNPSGFGRLVLSQPNTVHYASAQRDIPSRMGSGNWFKGQIPDGYLDANQRSGAETFRSGLFEQDYWNGAPVLQLDSQLVFAYQNGLQPPVVQFSVREGRPYPTTYQDWYAIGQQYAERYSPNSDWLVSQGITDYGVVWWGLGNEPDRGVRATPDSLDDVSPAVYAEMYRGYAEGIKSIDPEALVLVHGIRATGWDNPWLEAVAPLLNDGTLDALDIHKYVDTAQIKSGTWSMQYRFDLLKSQTGVTREDVLFTCTEFNTKEQLTNEDDAARGFLFTVWDAWGVVDGNGNPNTVFAFPWTIYFSEDTAGTVAAGNKPQWAMAERLDPWTPNRRGQTLQLVTELADGTSVVYSDPYEVGELKLAGEDKTIWVWNNWENATNSYGSSYTVRDIPADATTLEVWGYDGPWNGVRQTIDVTGKNSYTVDSLDQDQTYMFVINGDTTDSKTLSGVYKLLARHSGQALAVDLDLATNGGFADATANGVNVFQYGSDDADNRLWDIQPAGNGYYQLTSVYSGKALAVDLDSATNGGFADATADGVNVFQYGSDDADNRLWHFEQVAEGYYALVNKLSSKALTVDLSAMTNGGFTDATADGVNVQQREYGTSNLTNKQWQLVAVDVLPSDSVITGQVLVRAVGQVGDERMHLLVDGDTVQSWTVGITEANYRHQNYSGGDIEVVFDQSSDSSSVGVAFIHVCGVKHEAEQATLSDGSCSITQAGKVWLSCPGRLNFGDVGCTRGYGSDLVVEVSNSIITDQALVRAAGQGSNGFVVYPNPADEQLTLRGSEDYQVSIYDLRGQVVMRHQHLKGQAQLNISHLRPGVYVVKLNDGIHQSLQQRLVVE